MILILILIVIEKGWRKAQRHKGTKGREGAAPKGASSITPFIHFSS